MVVKGKLPTLELASVKLRPRIRPKQLYYCSISYLFNVVDLPDDGLPTRPIKGSLGIYIAGGLGAMNLSGFRQLYHQPFRSRPYSLVKMKLESECKNAEALR